MQKIIEYIGDPIYFRHSKISKSFYLNSAMPIPSLSLAHRMSRLSSLFRKNIDISGSIRLDYYKLNLVISLVFFRVQKNLQ